MCQTSLRSCEPSATQTARRQSPDRCSAQHRPQSNGERRTTYSPRWRCSTPDGPAGFHRDRRPSALCGVDLPQPEFGGPWPRSRAQVRERLFEPPQMGLGRTVLDLVGNHHVSPSFNTTISFREPSRSWNASAARRAWLAAFGSSRTAPRRFVFTDR